MSNFVKYIADDSTEDSLFYNIVPGNKFETGRVLVVSFYPDKCYPCNSRHF